MNAHHKNGAAERAIRTVSGCARALLLFSACHWKGEVTSELWPMAVDYAVYLYNHLPNERGISPVDLFTGVTAPRHKLRDYHIWGAPVYVLDPVLQAGKKLPRWQPRSRRGMFVGFSPTHSSDVPLILICAQDIFFRNITLCLTMTLAQYHPFLKTLSRLLGGMS